jgi:hypothetical protein
VRWLAARVRIEYLIAGAMKAAEGDAKKEAPGAQDKGSQEANEAAEKSEEKETGNEVKGSQRVAAKGGAQADKGGATAENDRKDGEKENRTKPDAGEKAA